MAELIEIAPVERMLVVVAHPDDVDFGSAGTVAKWVAGGSQIAYCIVTNGDAGGFDRDIDRIEMPMIRQREQRGAAHRVGVGELVFLGYRDGELTSTVGLRRDISRQIRRFRPDRVLCQSPERNYERIAASHPDHLASGEATLCAVYPDSRNPFAHPELLLEGMEIHSVSDIVMQGSPHPNAYVDITDFIDVKIGAILEHKSQHPDPAEVERNVRSWSTRLADRAGLAPGSYAELYQRVITN